MKAAKEGKAAKGRNAHVPSAGLKADKTAKTANGIVTSVTYLTVLTVWQVCAERGLHARGWAGAGWMELEDGQVSG